MFRNHTVEALFDTSLTAYSGYDDVSVVPEEHAGYIWFFQVPVKFNAEVLAQEIDSFCDKLRYVSARIANKPFVIFTMVNLHPMKFSTGDHRVQAAIDRFNAAARELAQSHPMVNVVDFSEFTSQYAVEQLVNWKFYFISQSLLSPKIAKDFKLWWQRIEKEIAGSRKKCLVLDLDNTLWGGVLGEAGIEGIKIGGDYPGNAFLCWQQALLELKRHGVILAVCSKNNAADVEEAWVKHPGLALRGEDFSACRINWTDKATNIRELATELNIGLDSMVFVDDNPTERAWVKQMLPEVEVPDFPEQPYLLPTFAKQLVDRYFRIYALTDDDRHKAAQYQANAQRKAAEQHFSRFEDFLQSLELVLKVEEATPFTIPRIAQLSQKTNQFNLTTRRYTEADITAKLANGAKVYTMSVSDKFGDYGITGAMIVEPYAPGKVKADTLMLSCRVLGKGLEFAFVCYVFNLLSKQRFSEMMAEYIPTKKNGQVKDFWEKVGGKLVSASPSASHYSIRLDRNFKIQSYYKILLTNGE
ncbi:MAG: HAD-IIIC family phosphatase [Sodaliphilus sp.]